MRAAAYHTGHTKEASSPENNIQEANKWGPTKPNTMHQTFRDDKNQTNIKNLRTNQATKPLRQEQRKHTDTPYNENLIQTQSILCNHTSIATASSTKETTPPVVPPLRNHQNASERTEAHAVKNPVHCHSKQNTNWSNAPPSRQTRRAAHTKLQDPRTPQRRSTQAF